MKAVWLGALIAAFTVGSAAAADMPLKAPPAPVYVPTWTGTYIGINGGYAWADSSHDDSFGTGIPHFSQNGGMAGVTFGGNWESSARWVVGFESDFDWADIKGTFNSTTLCAISTGSSCFTKMKEFSTERIRFGYDADGWLLFGTVGVGWGRVNAGQTPCGLTAFGGNSCDEKWRDGWVAGAGVEKMFLPHWSAKIEYLHFDFGNDINYTPTAVGGGNAVHVAERGDMVRVGINYQFDFLSLLPLH
jgi:outer membrane immunogenic protein